MCNVQMMDRIVTTWEMMTSYNLLDYFGSGEKPMAEHSWEYKEHSPNAQVDTVSVAIPHSFFQLEP